MKRVVSCLTLCLMCLVLGCASQGRCKCMVAKYTEKPVVLDGKLDDTAWKDAEVYTMYLPGDKLAEGSKLQENGKVRAAWNEDYFYLGIEFQDSDITATGEKDQLHHYRLGDLCELFLKPSQEKNYVELYVTPKGKKTSFYIPFAKNNRPGGIEDLACGLKVAGYVGDGTLNQRDDRDNWWSAEMAMPVKDLEKLGGKVEAGAQWRILVARYNYTKSSEAGEDDIEYSTTPPLSQTNYHLVTEYSPLYLER